jgi:hypothetical protein
MQAVDSFNRFYTTAYDALRQWDQVNMRLWRGCTEEQLDWIKLCSDYGSKQWDLLAKSHNNPAELLTAQPRMALEFSISTLGHFHRTRSLITDAADEIKDCLDCFKPIWLWTPATEAAEPEETLKVAKTKKQAA